MDEGLELEALEVGALPLVRTLLDRLGWRRLLERAFDPPDRRLRLSHVDAALLLVCNFALSRHPLYGVSEWVSRFGARALGLAPGQLELLNDDRLGRTLDRLFEIDRRSLTTQLVIEMTRNYGVDLTRFHNDSTSITFSGAYRYAGVGPRGRRLRITHGHNKDHRPDLKQLVWSLSICGDGALPVHYNVFDGNQSDDHTHIPTWKALCAIAARSDFLYVADSKLCSRENMAYVVAHGGHFLTVMPATRKEEAQFRSQLAREPVAWNPIWERPPQRRTDDPPDRFEAYEDAPTAEGYRLVWFRSSEKWKRDEQSRQSAIDQARFALQQLRERVGHRQLKTREQVQAAVDRILGEYHAADWVKVEIVEKQRHRIKQIGPGRPGPFTTFERETTTVFEPLDIVDAAAVQAAAAADGIFPLVTDLPVERLCALEMLQTYKYQAFIEKRHEQLKTAAEVVPVNFKNPERIEAFLFLYFLAITLHGLIERQVRRSMKERKLPSLPLYPEERKCRAPTADKIIHFFQPLRAYRLSRRNVTIQNFADPLSDLHRLILELLEIPHNAYTAGA